MHHKFDADFSARLDMVDKCKFKVIHDNHTIVMCLG